MLVLIWLYRVGCRDIRIQREAVERACREREEAALLARADRPQQQTLAGDPRGLTGVYPPEPLP